jgi:molybdopterin-containing oxidoreductase family membrane subunit
VDADETFDVLGKGNTLTTVTEKVSDVVLRDRLRPGWTLFFLFSLALLACLGISVVYLVLMGVGIWGINNTVGWGSTSSTSCGGSASATPERSSPPILLLVHQNWRTSINRFAEAMTIFAGVLSRGLFVLSHVGRHQERPTVVSACRTPWVMWPQFRSPLRMGRVRGSTLRLFSICSVCWSDPDLATLREPRQFGLD